MIPCAGIDPVLVSTGPFAIRWDGSADIAGTVFGRLVRRLAVQPPRAAGMSERIRWLFIFRCSGSDRS